MLSVAGNSEPVPTARRVSLAVGLQFAFRFGPLIGLYQINHDSNARAWSSFDESSSRHLSHVVLGNKRIPRPHGGGATVKRVVPNRRKKPDDISCRGKRDHDTETAASSQHTADTYSRRHKHPGHDAANTLRKKKKAENTNKTSEITLVLVLCSRVCMRGIIRYHSIILFTTAAA